MWWIYSIVEACWGKLSSLLNFLTPWFSLPQLHWNNNFSFFRYKLTWDIFHFFFFFSKGLYWSKWSKYYLCRLNERYMYIEKILACERNLNNFCHCLRKLTHRLVEYSIFKQQFVVTIKTKEKLKKKRKENVLILDWIKRKQKSIQNECVHKINNVYQFNFLFLFISSANGNKRRRLICYYFFIFENGVCISFLSVYFFIRPSV